MIYFDNTATSAIDPEVLEAMLPYLKEEYGNPSSKYYCKAETARNAVEESRAKVAKLLGTRLEEIIFTSGATESTNFIVKGYMDYRRYYEDGKNHIITSTVEHKATLNTCHYLNGDIYSNDDPTINFFGGKKRVDRGYEASFVSPNSQGIVCLEDVNKAIKENTAMCSVIYVNNETGSISELKSIAACCKEKNIAIHSDLTQAISKVDVNVHDLGLDYASCSAHKIYGPKGIGAAYVKNDAYGIQPITALMHGGEQEYGFRAGTLAVHNIVGFGKAAEIALRDIERNRQHISELDSKLCLELNKLGFVRNTIDRASRVDGIISIIIDKKDFNNERFIKRISEMVAISAGSACSLGKPSYVIKELGLGGSETKVLRISLSKHTTEKEIFELIEILKNNI